MLSAAEVIDFCVRLCLWRHSDGLNAGLNIVYILIGDKQCPVSKFLECCILDTPFRGPVVRPMPVSPRQCVSWH